MNAGMSVTWLSEIVSGEDAIPHLPEIGITVPLQEIYANAGLAEPRPDLA
jgi:hypothetical protein